MCSAGPPPHVIMHCRRVINPWTTECCKSRCTCDTHPNSQQIVVFNVNKLDGLNRYIRNSEYPYNQTFVGVKSGEKRGHANALSFSNQVPSIREHVLWDMSLLKALFLTLFNFDVRSRQCLLSPDSHQITTPVKTSVSHWKSFFTCTVYNSELALY